MNRSSIHPLQASKLIKSAIENGHSPPETIPSARSYLRNLIKVYANRGLSAHALEEINRCLQRGHIDECSLTFPIADVYLNLLISAQNSELSGKSPSLALGRAARVLAKLDVEGQLWRVEPATFDRLIEAMSRPAVRAQCNPGPVFALALKHGVPLSTDSWNTRFLLAAKRGHSAQSVLSLFRLMTTEHKVAMNKYTIPFVLKCISNDATQAEPVKRLVALSKQFGLFNEFVAIEELSNLKAQKKYSELLTTFATSFDSKLLLALGFQNTPKLASQEAYLALPKQAISLVIYAITRLNPGRSDVRHLYEAYRRYISTRPELQQDVFATTVFVSAFAKDAKSMETAMELLEEMRKWDQKPTVVTYTKIIEGLVEHGAVDLAATILEYMGTDGVQPVEYTWYCLIRGYLLEGNFDGARLCYKHMRKSRCIPSKRTKALISRIRESIT